jgi:hypothetical protein
MNSFLPSCNKNGISCFRLFLNYHNSRKPGRLSAPMLWTFNYMNSVTAACPYIRSTNSNKTSCELLCYTSKVRQEILSLRQTAGLTLRKWVSNHFTFLDNIPKEMQTNFVKCTTCFNPHHRWQQSRTPWPLKDDWKFISHIDPTSEDYGRQQSNPWSVIYYEHWVLRLPPTRNCAHYLLR